MLQSQRKQQNGVACKKKANEEKWLFLAKRMTAQGGAHTGPSSGDLRYNPTVGNVWLDASHRDLSQRSYALSKTLHSRTNCTRMRCQRVWRGTAKEDLIRQPEFRQRKVKVWREGYYTMLQITQLDSWTDFEKTMEAGLLAETQQMRTGPYLYRGHPDANWHLQTTLERSAVPNLTARAYFRMMRRIQTEIETFTGRNWDMPSEVAFLEDLAGTPANSRNPAYSYMAYLRHFGFPSPFLDWTYSPFVAAYFAFRDITNKAESVAIYAFLWASELGTVRVSDQAQIFPIAVSSRNNQRHYLQQSVYTVCLSKANGSLHYAGHEDPRMIAEDSGEFITKYILPASERVTALHSLEAHNINGYSLFGSEESLLDTLFLRTYRNAHIAKQIFSPAGDQDDSAWWH